MAMRDHKLVFSDSQVLTSGAVSNFTSTNVLDMGPLATGNLYRQLNSAQGGLMAVVRIETTPTSTGSATLAIKLVGDNNTGMTSTALVKTILAATAVASLSSGQRYIGILDPGTNVERYLQVEYNVATAPFSAGGTVTTFLTDRVDDWYAYAQKSGEDNGF